MARKKNKDDPELISELGEVRREIEKQIAKVIVGQRRVLEEMLIGLFAGGHCLLVGVPGLAKTLMVSTIAHVLDLSFSRIQFTPDLMPSDITGTEIMEEDPITKKRHFRFIKGPVFANIILADEINRTPPKTQSALLQAMQEREVTVAGETYSLPDPFFVLATQNPIEQEGTYPLPEAQLDRFFFEIRVDYPSMEEEEEIVLRTTGEQDIRLRRVIDAKKLLMYRALIRRMPVSRYVVKYAVCISAMTRKGSNVAPPWVGEWITWGAGPRASQFMVMAAKVRSALDGRLAPSPDDVKAVALPVLRHRIVLSFNAEADGITREEVVKRLLREVDERRFE